MRRFNLSIFKLFVSLRQVLQKNIKSMFEKGKKLVSAHAHRSFTWAIWAGRNPNISWSGAVQYVFKLRHPDQWAEMLLGACQSYSGTESSIQKDDCVLGSIELLQKKKKKVERK